MENYTFKDEPEWMTAIREESVKGWRGLDAADEGFRDWIQSTPASADPEGSPKQVSHKMHAVAIQETLRADGNAGLSLRQGAEASVIRLRKDLSEKGVVFMDLEQAVRERPELVRDHLTRLLPSPESNLCVEHYARMDGGTVLFVPDSVQVELPFECVNYYAGRSPGGRTYPHLLVVAGNGSDVTVVERLYSLHSIQVNAGAEFFVGDGGTLRFVSLQALLPSGAYCGFYRFRCGRDSRLVATFAGLGGQASQMDIRAVLPESGAECRINGLSFPIGRQRMSWRVALDHQGVRTTSGLQYKTAVKDAARSDFLGTVRIAPGAQRTNAFQSSRSLLLSDGAQAESRPVLEIEANDVHCKHSATTGTLSEDELFYLMSRGLPEAEASRLLIEGYFEPITARLGQESMRGEIARIIEEKVLS